MSENLLYKANKVNTQSSALFQALWRSTARKLNGYALNGQKEHTSAYVCLPAFAFSVVWPARRPAKNQFTTPTVCLSPSYVIVPFCCGACMRWSLHEEDFSLFGPRTQLT